MKCYEVLGIEEASADKATIGEAYRKRMRVLDFGKSGAYELLEGLREARDEALRIERQMAQA
jgi:hypothetical protein